MLTNFQFHRGYDCFLAYPKYETSPSKRYELDEAGNLLNNHEIYFSYQTALNLLHIDKIQVLRRAY